jgi:hypothetical protein
MNFKCVISGSLCCVCVVISLRSWLFLWFYLLEYSRHYLCLMVVLNFSVAVVPLLQVDVIFSRVHILTRWVFLLCLATWFKGYTRLGASLLEEGRGAGFRNVLFFWKKKGWTTFICHRTGTNAGLWAALSIKIFLPIPYEAALAEIWEVY